MRPSFYGLLDNPDRLLWEHLRRTERPIVLWGMGNGADKILDTLEAQSIPIAGIFASDGFKQGKLFRGMRVESRAELFDRLGEPRPIVLLAFGSSRPEVLANVRAVMEQTELLVPDVPAFGGGLFDADFARARADELEQARGLLSDEESRRIFDLTVAYKLSGRADCLFSAVSDRGEVMRDLIRPTALRGVLDLGAYNGDTVRELLDAGARPTWVRAVEADLRTYRRLEVYAKSETRCAVTPICGAAWDSAQDVLFDAAGNRGAAAGQGGKRTVSVRGLTGNELLGDAVADYIKFDVEGAERRAIEGLAAQIERDLPTLAVSVYHRNEDLFALPLLIRDRFPAYRGFYLRRRAGLPAWDLELFVRRD